LKEKLDRSGPADNSFDVTAKRHRQGRRDSQGGGILNEMASISVQTSRIGRQGLAFDILVAVAATMGAVAARLAIEHVVGGVAPFVLTFPAVMIATLVGGGRAGTIAAVSCQLLTIRYVFPNWVSPHGGISTDLANMVLSTVALAGTIWATASHRRAAAVTRGRCEQQVHTLSLLNAEMDHRTKNNYQIAAGLLAHQSLSSLDPAVARELDMAAARLETIASVYQDLPAQLDHTRSIDLADHLERVVSLLRSGAAPEYITIRYRADHIQASGDVAVVAGLIVNEWVTNALQHAFGDGPGRISVDVADKADHIRVTVVDDGGAGRQINDGQGQGSNLMTSLAKAIRGEVTIDYHGGTRCTLMIPAGAGS